MAKQNLNIGSSANDGTGDSLRDGAIKLNSVIDELYTSLGNDTNLQINVGSPSTGQFLKWNGSQFAEGALDSLTSDLDVAGQKIISSASGDITLQPNGTGDIKFWAGGTGAALTYVDGADGKLKYSNVFATTGDLPDNTVHHGMFAYVSGDTTGRVATAGGWKKLIGEDHSIGALSDVDLTVGGGASDGQVLKWDGSNNYWYPANDETATGGGGSTQNLFETINADSGSTTASAATDTLTIAGGSNISTSIAGDTVTIAMTGTLGAPDQNVFTTIGTDNNSKTANSASTLINFIGGTGISTDVAGDNLTITNSSPNVVQNALQSVSGDTGTYTAAAATSGVEVLGGTGVTTALVSNQLTITAELGMKSGQNKDENGNVIFCNNGTFERVDSPAIGWNIGANGSASYNFNGAGVATTDANPTLYLYRGFTYRFNNTTGASHPFEIKVSAGGALVTDGVSGDTEGIQYYTVPMDLAAGTTYKYQCGVPSHVNMIGDLVIV